MFTFSGKRGTAAGNREPSTRKHCFLAGQPVTDRQERASAGRTPQKPDRAGWDACDPESTRCLERPPPPGNFERQLRGDSISSETTTTHNGRKSTEIGKN